MTPTECLSLLQDTKNALRISTGSKQLDNMLNGGILSGCITEFEGEFRTGKSQLCMTLSVMCQLSSTNPGKVSFCESNNVGKAFYLDTYGKFSVERVALIAEGHCDIQTALQNISYMRIYNMDHLLQVLTTVVPQHLMECRHSLVVVDSIISLYVTGLFLPFHTNLYFFQSFKVSQTTR